MIDQNFLQILILGFLATCLHAAPSAQWYKDGNPVSNNAEVEIDTSSAIQLTCKASTSSDNYRIIFIIVKSDRTPVASDFSLSGIDGSSTSQLKLGVSNEVIYDDVNGVAPLHENFMHLQPRQMAGYRSGNFNLVMYSYTAALTDKGTYWCAVFEVADDSIPSNNFAVSQAIKYKIAVAKGKSAAKSTKSSNIIKYSALLVAASKLYL